MSGELAVSESRLAVVPKYSNEQVKLLADTIAKGCDENELKLFLEISKLARLNPFTGQIRPVKRWDSALGREAMVIQTGIDGFRATASRTGDHAGTDDAVFDSETEQFPKWAKVTVYRWSHGEKAPFTATARWSEYVQKKRDGGVNSMWSRMPYLMLAKCAEALALRKAFPDELAGIYTEEEMMQADNPDPDGEGERRQPKPPVSQPTRASEKKTEGQVVSTAISGVIETSKVDKQNDLWVTVPDHLLLIRKDKATAQMVSGVHISVEARKLTHMKIGDYWLVDAVKEVKENIPDGEVVDEDESQESPVDEAEVSQEAPMPAAAAPVVESLKELFDQGKVQTGKQMVENGGTMSKRDQAWRATVGHDPAKHISYKQGNLLFKIQSERQLSEETVHGLLEEEFGVAHRPLIPKDIFGEVLDAFDPDFKFHEKK